jgi:hypothetical protein
VIVSSFTDPARRALLFQQLVPVFVEHDTTRSHVA